jgi:hypothetical protein
MNQYKIAIVALLAMQAVTLFLLWITHKDRQFWQAIWTATAAELLLWKRNAVLRDPKSGKYIRKDKRP